MRLRLLRSDLERQGGGQDRHCLHPPGIVHLIGGRRSGPVRCVAIIVRLSMSPKPMIMPMAVFRRESGTRRRVTMRHRPKCNQRNQQGCQHVP